MADVVFINCFEVPPGREAAFLALWTQIDDFMCAQPGFRWRRLHLSLNPDARLRYVNVAGWESAEQFDAAHGEEFRRLQGQPEWLEFPALPSLYTVEQETRAPSLVDVDV
ncbi:MULTISPECIES: antibiotic biosynthesis monooxygenase [Streptacidiphilus]|uniref:Antibiotic biosynthesis monooxygenase n=1 Tax=Streptacidiphilus cavernicola TaxID=3342716 RepID=A0ABV6UNM1_9ACTN|nr:antibiotic biosynthesis monooxygenase family protein [Streptacidiphilus jeojiense]